MHRICSPPCARVAIASHCGEEKFCHMFVQMLQVQREKPIMVQWDWPHCYGAFKDMLTSYSLSSMQELKLPVSLWAHFNHTQPTIWTVISFWTPYYHQIQLKIPESCQEFRSIRGLYSIEQFAWNQAAIAISVTFLVTRQKGQNQESWSHTHHS